MRRQTLWQFQNIFEIPKTYLVCLFSEIHTNMYFKKKQIIFKHLFSFSMTELLRFIFVMEFKKIHFA